MKNIINEMKNLEKVFDYCATANKRKEIKINLQGYTMTLLKKRCEKKGNKWVVIEQEEKEINEKYYENIINARHFFENLGGKEIHCKSYTYIGYIVTTIHSISPDRKSKSVYEFTVK